MTDIAQSGARAPWHLWLVGALGLLWNAYGCFDYFMTVTGGDAYLRDLGMTEAQIAYYAAMPPWTIGVWAIGVWGALAGSILLLLRSQWAFIVFAISFAAFLLSVVYTYALSNGAEVTGQASMIVSGVIALGCLFFVWYAWAMKKAGVLR